MMDELIQSFGPEDSQKVGAIQEAFRELTANVAHKEVSAKALIQEMTSAIGALEGQAVPPEPAGAHEARMQGLSREVAGVRANIEQGTAHVEGQQRQRQAIRQRLEHADREKDAVAAFASELQDAQRHLALLKHISRIDLDPAGWPSR